MCLQKAGSSARTEVYAIEEWERVQAEAAQAKEQEEAILVSSRPRALSCTWYAMMLGHNHSPEFLELPYSTPRVLASCCTIC